MKETLKENIERMRMDIVNRIDQPYNRIKEYEKSENFESAMKCDIKRRTLLVVLGRLDEALE